MSLDYASVNQAGFTLVGQQRKEPTNERTRDDTVMDLVMFRNTNELLSCKHPFSIREDQTTSITVNQVEITVL